MLKGLVVFASLIFLSYACLITNCPRGGKRGDIAPLETVAREVRYILYIFFSVNSIELSNLLADKVDFIKLANSYFTIKCTIKINNLNLFRL